MPPSSKMQSAGQRAVNANAGIQRKAARVAEMLDEMPSGGVPVVEINEEDSLVITVENAIAAKEESQANVALARTRSRDLTSPPK